nr:inter-alpha-trypsin inhibitor heavy chain H4-like isoform X6 [Leptinotarsa decemlineata]
MKRILFCFLATLCTLVLAAPSDNSFVVASEEKSKENEKDDENVSGSKQPIIYGMDIKSNVSNRFAKTLVISKVRNPDTKAKEATFTVVLPEKAFISEFVMEIGGKSYKAYVKEKEEAKQDYDRAVASGQSAGHVEVSARDSNRFTVSVNVEPEAKAVFLLTYEELLEREHNQYELVLNIHPGQIIKDLNVEVLVNESRPLKFVKTPSLRSGNEVSKNDEKLKPSSEIEIINSTSAVVRFHPDAQQQRQFAKELGVKENEGISGQFVVQYDVERDPRGGEILLQDGYFVHFFAPEDLEPLPKQVVFVLDTSSSMSGEKIHQLKDAMNSILDEIREGDVFNIVEFNSDVFVWDIETGNSKTVEVNNIQDPFEDLLKSELPPAIIANNETLKKAKNVIEKIRSWGATNIIGGLETGLHLVKVNTKYESTKEKKHQPMIVFLTDGQPNVGEWSTDKITEIVTRLNEEVPIFSLSFGEGADKSFLRKLSQKNFGFSRHIYEGSDASLQLQEFYKLISSPLLSKVNFKYNDNVTEVTQSHFPIFFRGTECVVSGRIRGPDLHPVVEAHGFKGEIRLIPKAETPITSLERLWAYLTVKQKLKQRETAENKTQLTKEALDLALKYSFVTEVSSLVVVKPNETAAVDTEDASVLASVSGGYPGAAGFGGGYAARLPLPQNRIYSSALAPDTRYQLTTPFLPDGWGQPDALDITKDDEEESVPTSSLEDSLPWLNDVLDANKSLNISGVIYDIGKNATVPPGLDCPKTPENGTIPGQCTLLKDCPEVFTYLIDFQVYLQYFCPLETTFAGVCCPKKK